MFLNLIYICDDGDAVSFCNTIILSLIYLAIREVSLIDRFIGSNRRSKSLLTTMLITFPIVRAVELMVGHCNNRFRRSTFFHDRPILSCKSNLP